MVTDDERLRRRLLPTLSGADRGHRREPAGGEPPERRSGALPADMSRQRHVSFSPDVKRTHYRDRSKRCADCGEDFVFSASEQKHWYEVLQIPVEVAAKRCRACRAARRAAVVAQEALERAAARARSSTAPGDQLDYAAALAGHIEHVGGGDPDKVIAAARRARSMGDQAESHYWEGVGQQLAGRSELAAACFSRSLELQGAPRTSAQRQLLAATESRLAQLSA